MKEFLIFLAPITGLFGIFVGAFLQAHFTRKNQKSSHLSELQNRAYADFLNAASSVAVFQRLGQREKVSNELTKLADAKSRICVYGDSIIIKNMAEFFRKGGTLQTESEILSFARLCLSIRNSIGIKKDRLGLTDISQLLFSIDIKDTPTPNSRTRS